MISASSETEQATEDKVIIATAETNACDEENQQQMRNDGGDDSDELLATAKSSFCCTSTNTIAATFWTKYSFPCLVCVAILMAYVYPPLGAVYLQPDITASWATVIVIFLLSGLGLKTNQFATAFKRVDFQIFVQLFNFLFISSVFFGVSRLLVETNLINEALADGMVICSCLPVAISVVIVLTVATGGDEAAAILNATLGNIIGIFVSPALILMYLGSSSGSVSVGDIIYKLVLRIIVPLLAGQLVQNFWKPVHVFFEQHKPYFKKLQEYGLVFIVYTVFCETFDGGSVDATIGSILVMTVCLFVLMIGCMGVAWFSLKLLFRDDPELRVMGVFGCVQKTIALGVPLISTMYEHDPNEGLYALPILIYYPMQLVVGSLLITRLSQFVIDERQRVNATTKKQEIDSSAIIVTPPTVQNGDENENEEEVVPSKSSVKEQLPEEEY